VAGRNAVGIDVGGSSIKAVSLTPAGTVVEQRQVELPATESGILAAIAALADGLGAGPSLGVCVAGVVDEEAGVALAASNLPWSSSPLRGLISDATGRTVVLGHDVRCGARAELRWGTASSSMLYIAIGTGISSVSLVDGQMLPGLYAGEIGQVLVAAPGQPLERVALERLASASAIVRRFEERAPGTLAASAGAREVIALMGAIPAADAVVGEAVAALAAAVAVAVAVTAPSVVVIAGGVAAAGAAIVDPLANELRVALGLVPAPCVVASPLGQFGQAMGAASLVIPLQ